MLSGQIGFDFASALVDDEKKRKCTCDLQDIFGKQVADYYKCLIDYVRSDSCSVISHQ